MKNSYSPFTLIMMQKRSSANIFLRAAYYKYHAHVACKMLFAHPRSRPTTSSFWNEVSAIHSARLVLSECAKCFTCINLMESSQQP